MGLIGAVDFGYESLQYGWAGRHFGNGDRCAVFGGDLGQCGTHAFGDVVALGGAFVLAHEVDLNVGHVGAATHEVVAHETVKIERRGSAGVDLIVAHLRLGADGLGHFASDVEGLLQRGAFGRVYDDLKLRLVVEWQHLDLHATDEHEHGRADQQEGNDREECPLPQRVVHERVHHAVIHAGE